MELANEAVLAEAMQMGQELPPLRFTLLDAFQNPLSLRGRSVTVHNVFAHTGTLDTQRAKAKVRHRSSGFAASRLLPFLLELALLRCCPMVLSLLALRGARVVLSSGPALAGGGRAV
eukprot:3803191-Rhodomonas_salina.1